MSEPTIITTDPNAAVTTTTVTAPVEFTPPASQADLDRIVNERLAREKKKFADYNELKTKASKLDELTASQQTELEKAVAKALDEGKTAGRKEAATIVAAARLEAALTGLVPDPRSIVEDLNLTKFVTDDGEVDEDAVKALREKYAATTGTTAPGPRPDLTQGAQASSVALNSDELADTVKRVLST
jgi:hypothetical protein